MQKSQNIIVGIAGPSGSGKTLFASKLIKKLNTEDITVIRADDYYNSNHGLSLEQRNKINYDHPSALDQEFLVSQLIDLRNGIDIEMPSYDYITNQRREEHIKVSPNRIIVLEGFLVLALKKVRPLIDIKIYVDTPLDICLARRIERDIVERGATISKSLEQYRNHVRPMFLKYLEPSKKYANIIVPRGGRNNIALDIIKARIAELCQS